MEKRQLRDLPVPHQTKWSSTTGLNPCERYVAETLADPFRVNLNEQERFQSLPADIKEDERSNMHEFVFGKNEGKQSELALN